MEQANNKRISVQFNAKLTPKKELNSDFTLCKCYVCGTKKNRNYTYFSKNTIEKMIPTLNYVPVVGHLYKNKDEKWVMGSHDYEIDENFNFKSLCVPFGVVKSDSFDFETIEEYGKNVEYLIADIVLWTGRYPELKEAIYSEDTWFNQSIELNVSQYRPLEEDSNYTEIVDGEFSALCLLGKSDNKEENVEPCFINAKVEPYKYELNDEFMGKMKELKFALSEYSKKEGSDKMDKPKNNETTEPQADNLENESEPGTLVSNYQLTANEKRDNISQALRTLEKVTKDYDVWYYLCDFDDKYAYVEEHIYNRETDSCSEKKGRIEYSVQDNCATLVSDLEEMRCMWVTIDESKRIEEARDSYDSILKENNELRQFQLDVQTKQRHLEEEKIFERFESSLKNCKEFNELKENSKNYTLEQIEKECYALIGVDVMKNEQKDSTTESTLRFSLQTSENSKKSPYGDVFEKYGNKN